MWVDFFVSYVTATLLLYLPGLPFALGLRGKLYDGVILAPLVTFVGASAVAIVYSKLGISSSWLGLLLPVFLAGLLLFVCRLGIDVSYKKQLFSRNETCCKSHDWLLLLLSIVAAFVVGMFFFVKTLDGPASFNQGPDNVHHLALIETFTKTGFYSPLSTTLYPASEGFIAPSGADASSGSFYPSAWFCWASLVSQAASVSTPIAANVTLFALLSISWPTSVYFFIRHLFPNDIYIKGSASLAGIAFSAFPWMLLYFGPLYPNFAGLAFVPMVGTLFLEAIDFDTEHRAASSIFFVVGLLSLVLLHTNSVFTLAVIMIPAVISYVYRWSIRILSQFFRSFSDGRRKAIALIVSAIAVVLVYALWKYINGLPFLESIVSYPWYPYSSIRQELVNIFLLAYRSPQAQIPLAVMVIAGAIWLSKQRNFRWILSSYLLTCIMVFVAATREDWIDELLNGFWYTDPYRIAANAAIAAIPLAACGLAVFLKRAPNACRRIISFVSPETEASARKVRFKESAAYAACIAVFALLNFYPNFEIPGIATITTAFGQIEDDLTYTNASVGTVLDKSEQDFLEDVSEVVGEDLVINLPDDGSLFGYSVYGINMFYRSPGMEAYGNDTEQSKLFRYSLDELSYNPSVQEAVKSSGARYVLLLDSGEELEEYPREYFDHYWEGGWVGLDAITPDTEGFTLVMHEGDMYLYRIDSTYITIK